MDSTGRDLLRVDAQVSDALRQVRLRAPQAPSPEIGAGLAAHFRRYHRRRRMLRGAGVLAIVLVAMIGLLFHTVKVRQPEPQFAAAVGGTAPAPSAPAMPDAP